MSSTFDPYLQWLGIPPAEQPPNHYRLLDLALSETDRTVIAEAAERRLTQVRPHRGGEHSVLAQRLLNEIAVAKYCLLDRRKKAEYDAEMQRSKAAPSAKPKAPAQPRSATSKSASSKEAKPKSSSTKSSGGKTPSPKSDAAKSQGVRSTSKSSSSPARFTPVANSQQLFELLKRSNLLSPTQFERAVAIGDLLRRAAQDPRGIGVVAEHDPRLLATQMVRQNLVTAWQAKNLLAGRHAFFLGKYKLLELLGADSRGKSYRAEHVTMRRIVALKVMARELLSRPGALARFQREVRATALVSHPNIIATYDGDCIGQTHFLVTEYVQGRRVDEWIKECGRMSVDWSCECVRQVCLGLQHAFQQGVIHRDIRPSNLLVADDASGGPPRIKIMDLGLARMADWGAAEKEIVTHAGEILGDPDYMAPEQARDSRTADIRSDIFSAGCVLFELLTGTPPYAGANAIQKLAARMKQDAPAVSQLRPDVPPPLVALVAKMLARDPAQRFQTPADVADGLTPFAFRKQGLWDDASSVAFPNRSAQLGRLEADNNVAEGELAQFLNQLATKAGGRGPSSRPPRKN